MTTTPELISEDELHAYVDGCLDQARRPAAEAYLAANPREAERVAAYRSQKQALHALYDPISDEPVPSAMGRRPARSWGMAISRAAAAVALILVGGAGGWWVHGLQEDQGPAVVGLADRAARAYTVFTPEVLHPVEVTAENEAHLVKWLSKRLGAPLRAPTLSGLGYGLVGGRLLAGRRGPAALFVYENPRGERLTVYVRRAGAAGKETAFRYAHKDRVGVFYWIDGPLAYAIAGEIEKPRLLEVANAIYRQLNP